MAESHVCGMFVGLSCELPPQQEANSGEGGASPVLCGINPCHLQQGWHRRHNNQNSLHAGVTRHAEAHVWRAPLSLAEGGKGEASTPGGPGTRPCRMGTGLGPRDLLPLLPTCGAFARAVLCPWRAPASPLGTPGSPLPNFQLLASLVPLGPHHMLPGDRAPLGGLHRICHYTFTRCMV